MKSKIFEFFFGFIFLVKAANSQFDGDSCTLAHNGQAGLCRDARMCPEVIALFRQGLRYTTCAYTGRTHLVCCPSKKTAQVSYRDNSAGISAKKCDEYKSSVRKQYSVAGLTASFKVHEISSETCRLSSGLIVGGTKANKGEFPHAVAIGQKAVDTFFFCGGSLISERFILTAAHCRKPNAFARLGALNVKNSGQDFKITDFIRHEEYDKDSKQNDIAVAKLERDVRFTNEIRPACLWQSQHLPQQSVTAIGWGHTEYGASAGSEDLLKVSLDIFELNKCVEAFSDDDEIEIDDKQLCIGISKGVKDTCQGDSGGPIQIVLDDNKCTYHIVGITSFGGICGSGNSVSVYVNVAKYIPWIEQKVWG